MGRLGTRGRAGGGRCDAANLKIVKGVGGVVVHLAGVAGDEMDVGDAEVGVVEGGGEGLAGDFGSPLPYQGECGGRDGAAVGEGG